ncbi:sterol desaturase family protein [Marinomonas sp. NPDC078689]|jgi:sterol desaturase/sphingolipid hydroxylase (fatty acid hydroxylase superfamily)|uniref:sterol desaturase family protein n=1 Tax=Marinomonas sp. NPDC078689 TaxID=3364147 RepID=UPI0037CA7BB3
MAISSPLEAFLNGSERVFWGYLLVSAIIALVWYVRQGNTLSWVQLKRYWWSLDARLDYRYFLVNWLIKTLLILPVLLSGQTVALWTLSALNAVADPLFLPWYYRDIVLLYTLSLFVLEDLSRYALHRWMHSNPWLWKIHQVHHSAEALNPLTFYRLHPLENILFALRHAVVAGMVTGVFIFCFGARVNLYTVLGGNLFIVSLFAFTGNLRHSHIRLGYGRWLERVLISPAQHQVHHQRRHMRHNFGSALAIWDGLFGTLKVSREAPDDRSFGLGDGKRRHFDSVRKLLMQPFFSIYSSIRRTLK